MHAYKYYCIPNSLGTTEAQGREATMKYSLTVRVFQDGELIKKDHYVKDEKPDPRFEALEAFVDASPNQMSWADRAKGRRAPALPTQDATIMDAIP